jgi:hypothetical protein
MQTILRTLSVLTAASLLAACASTVAAVEGPVEVNKAYTVTLKRPWTKIADSADSYWTRGDRLTQDGESLNAIRLIGNLKNGDYIVRPQRKDLPTPVYKAAMTELELGEFVTDSLGAMGYEQVASGNVRPKAFGSLDGVAMDLTASTPRGLKMKGEARLAKAADQLNVMVFMAPELHYHDAYKAEVEAIFDSAVTK